MTVVVLIYSHILISWYIVFEKRVKLVMSPIVSHIALILIVYQTLHCSQINSTSSSLENGTNLKHNFRSFIRILRIIMHSISALHYKQKQRYEIKDIYWKKELWVENEKLWASYSLFSLSVGGKFLSSKTKQKFCFIWFVNMNFWS